MDRKDDVKISVIVTVHNAEKYLWECMESVLNQTFSEMEVLCMDGGSTDNTPQILRVFAEKDSRVRIVNDSNTSYGHKVNRGIEEARGEYVSVLESDDMYEPFMLELLYETAERYHTDFVNADYTSFFDIDGQRIRQIVKMYPDDMYNRLINYKEQPEAFGIITRYWTGLFRKAYLQKENIKMNESPGASYQDMSFRFLTSILAERAYHLDASVYLYRIDNPDSSMYDVTKTLAIAEEHNFLKQELSRRNITNCYVWHNAYQWKYTDFRGNMLHLRGKNRQELFQRYLHELERDRDSLKQYSYLGYRRIVSEMIMEAPEDVERLVEADAKEITKRRNHLHCFLERIIGLGKEDKIVVFGCGKRGNEVLELIKFAEDKISCLTDNCKSLWKTIKNNHEILAPEDAVKQYPDAMFIIANKLYAQDIAAQLRHMGICETKICIYGETPDENNPS